MSYLANLSLYLRLGAFTRGSFERTAGELLNRKEHLSMRLKNFFESPDFLDYWREQWRHSWRAVSNYGMIELGLKNKQAALEDFARINPRARILSVDEVHHFIFFTADRS
jgi:hypothetical protein